MHTVVNLSFLQKMLVIKNMYILNIKIRSTHMLNPNSKFLDIIKVPEFQKHYSDKDHSLNLVKVEKILKGSLISIPSPSVKIKLWAGKFAGPCQQTFEKRVVDITQHGFALLPQVNFPDNNLNFH